MVTILKLSGKGVYMKAIRKQSGFTLIEVIVVAGIIAVLAGILVPLIFKEIDESKISRAKADVKSISSALVVLKKDTGAWPGIATPLCAAIADTALTGSGSDPNIVGAGWDLSSTENIDHFLNTDSNGCWPNSGEGAWKGPYMAHVGSDPWGRRYILNSADFANPAAPVWVISAGPDGNLDTATANNQPAGDDIGVRIR